MLAAFETIEECSFLTSKRAAGRGWLVDHSLSMCSKPSDVNLVKCFGGLGI